MTISQIKAATAQTSPYYFDRQNMRFFGQTLASFKVYKQPDGRYKICAPMKDRSTGRIMGESVRYYNPINNELEHN